jgi:hypothetical protein
MDENQILFHDMPGFYRTVDAVLATSISEGAGKRRCGRYNVPQVCSEETDPKWRKLNAQAEPAAGFVTRNLL